MILNGYAILVLFAAGLRLLLAPLVVGLALAGSWRRVQAECTKGAERHEDRHYLAMSLTLLLILLNLLSWPLVYLLLLSYVPHWSGVMCIYGVMEVGAGSTGATGYLPALLRFLQLSKPLLLFLGGGWLVLYVLNRQTRTAPLMQRLAIMLLPLGTLAAADAAAELAYVVIPKKDEVPSAGCCTTAFGNRGGPARLASGSLDDGGHRRLLSAAYYGCNLALILGMTVGTRRRHRLPGSLELVLMLFGGLIVLAIGSLFLVDVAVPTLLELPYHRCPYDLIAQVPEAVVAVTIFLAGCFALGWAAVARWCGRCPETEPLIPGMVRGLLRISRWGFIGSLIMMTLELALA